MRILLILMAVGAVVLALSAYGLRAHYAEDKLAAADRTLAPAPAGRPVPPPRDGRARLVFLGDSRIAMWPFALTPRDGWQVWLSGIGGETTGQMRARALAELPALDPDILVVQGGINDLVAAGLNPDRATALAAAIPVNLASMAEAALSQGARRVILTTVVRPARVPIQRWLVWSPRIPVLVAEVNDQIRALGAMPGVEILDADRILAGQGVDPLSEAFARDTLHWHDAAYRRLTESLVELL